MDKPKEYKIVNGTHYHINTNDEVIKVLEKCRHNRTRIVLDYGDTITGKSWEERHNITGYVSRSTGTNKIPILVYNNRSLGGGSILSHCIIKISTSKGKYELYNLNQ